MSDYSFSVCFYAQYGGWRAETEWGREVRPHRHGESILEEPHGWKRLLWESFWGKERGYTAMAFHYDEVKDKDEGLTFIKGYEIGWDVPVRLIENKENYNDIALLNKALMVGYWMGVEASRQSREGKDNE